MTETLPGDAEPLAAISVVAFGGSAGPAGSLAEGSTVHVSGYLEWKPEWGRLRVIAQRFEFVSDG